MAKDKKTADDLYHSDVKLADFAKTLAEMPKLSGLMRAAGLRDARTMASVRLTSARVSALRAEALGDRRAAAKAHRAEAAAAHMAQAMTKEEGKAMNPVDIMGTVVAMAGEFRLVGKVMDAKGNPVPGAKVEVSGEKTGVIFTAETDKNGTYVLGVPVGAGKDMADEGETLSQSVLLDGKRLLAELAGRVKEGSIMHRILNVPLKDSLMDLAAPIAVKRQRPAEKPSPAKSAKGKKAASGRAAKNKPLRT
jgi:hypothetical protein